MDQRNTAKQTSNNNNLNSFSIEKKEQDDPKILQEKELGNHTFSQDISYELKKALSLLKNGFPSENNEEFFKAVMKDITSLLEILNEMTLEASTFSESLKHQVHNCC